MDDGTDDGDLNKEGRKQTNKERKKAREEEGKTETKKGKKQERKQHMTGMDDEDDEDDEDDDDGLLTADSFAKIALRISHDVKTDEGHLSPLMSLVLTAARSEKWELTKRLEKERTFWVTAHEGQSVYSNSNSSRSRAYHQKSWFETVRGPQLERYSLLLSMICSWRSCEQHAQAFLHRTVSGVQSQYVSQFQCARGRKEHSQHVCHI